MIAACALVISAAATVTSVLQTRVFANQLSATVWPYLSFSLYESDTQFRYTLDNDGLGPAILRSAKVELDGKSYPSFRSVGFALMGRTKPGKKQTLRSSSLSVGQVIRPGISDQVIEYDGAGARALIQAAVKRTRITVCYCSLLEQCWILTSFINGRGPTQVSRCGESTTVDA